jgi:LPXTG-motif cell wall-anchored protein
VKKIIKISLAVLIIWCAMITNVKATYSGKMNLQTDKTEIKQNEEVVVEVALSDVVTDKGIIALGATLEYDKNALTFVKIEGVNNWTTPTYNEANGKLVTDKSSFSTGNETVFKITFKAKENINSNTLIKLKDIEVADGSTETTLSEATINLAIKGTSNTAQTNNNQSINITQTSDNNQKNTNQSTNLVQTKTSKTSDTSGSILPYTGENNNNIVFIILIFIAAIIGLIFYLKINRINKKIKENE